MGRPGQHSPEGHGGVVAHDHSDTGQADDETTRAERRRIPSGQEGGKATSELSSGTGYGRRSSLYTRRWPSSAGPDSDFEDTSLAPFGQQLPQLELGALDVFDPAWANGVWANGVYATRVHARSDWVSIPGRDVDQADERLAGWQTARRFL